MNKEYLEAFNIIKFNPDDVDGLQYLEAFKVVESALQRLESIDNAKPSEAMCNLEYLYDDAKIESGWVKEHVITYAEEHKHNDRIKPYYENIKQALLRLEQYDKIVEEFKDLPFEQRLEFFKQDIILMPILEEYQENKKVLEIIKEHIKFEDRGIETYTDDFKNLVTKFLIRLESKDTGATFHIHLDTEEEFDTLKRWLENE